MPTEIKQVRDEANERTVLRVSGEMFRSDAELLRRIAEDIHRELSEPVALDLGDLDLLDSEAAHILRQLTDQDGFTLEGTDVLLQSAIDEAERQSGSN
jgi:anti-anti-sigma regulatory factor